MLRSRRRLLRQPLRIPDPLRELLVERLPRVEVSLLELSVRPERQPALSNQPLEPRVVVVGALVKAPREQVLPGVVLALLLVREVSVARVEALGQEHQPADAVAILL